MRDTSSFGETRCYTRSNDFPSGANTSVAIQRQRSYLGQNFGQNRLDCSSTSLYLNSRHAPFLNTCPFPNDAHYLVSRAIPNTQSVCQHRWHNAANMRFRDRHVFIFSKYKTGCADQLFRVLDAAHSEKCPIEFRVMSCRGEESVDIMQDIWGDVG